MTNLTEPTELEPGKAITQCYGKSIWNLPKDELLRFLDEDLASKVEGEGARVILDEVPEDGIEIIEQWKNQNPEVLGGTEVSIKPTSSGLTAEEEEENRKILFSELPCDRPRVAKARVTVLENLANSSEAPEEWKPRRFSAQLKWWKKSLEEAEALDQRNAEELQRKKEHDQKHQNIGKGPRATDRKTLKTLIRKIDKTLCESLGRKAKHSEIVVEFQINYHKYDKSLHIKHLDLDEDSFEYGDGFFMRWGQQFSKLISESRKDMD